MNKKNIKWLLFPIIAVIVIGLGYGIWNMGQRVNGTDPDQIEAYNNAMEAAEQSRQSMNEQGQWYNDQYYQNSPEPEEVILSSPNN